MAHNVFRVRHWQRCSTSSTSDTLSSSPLEFLASVLTAVFSQTYHLHSVLACFAASNFPHVPCVHQPQPSHSAFQELEKETWASPYAPSIACLHAYHVRSWRLSGGQARYCALVLGNANSIFTLLFRFLLVLATPPYSSSPSPAFGYTVLKRLAHPQPTPRTLVATTRVPVLINIDIFLIFRRHFHTFARTQCRALLPGSLESPLCCNVPNHLEAYYPLPCPSSPSPSLPSIVACPTASSSYVPLALPASRPNIVHPAIPSSTLPVQSEASLLLPPFSPPSYVPYDFRTISPLLSALAPSFPMLVPLIPPSLSRPFLSVRSRM
ncbi:hypothetical protein C8R44DRAFT_890540 [Mycena epipterygia]|nr:hypothetical protein C8R44DRAFT_890540 [Mycena epipterygia]